jgi:protein ImuB
MSDETVPRLVTLWCPEWPTVAGRVPPGLPAAVFHANRVIACTPAARAAGVTHGDRRRVAQAACPELQLLERDTDRDAREFEPVVRAISDMAPRVEVVEPGWLSVAARGPARYFGGDHPLAERIVAVARGVAGAGSIGADPDLGVGIADGRSASAIASRLAARRADRVVVVPPGRSPEFVEPLAIGWLREMGELDAELVDLFVRLGIRTLGRLAALDPGDVLSRFGTVGLHAHRLAGGADLRPPATVDPHPGWWVEHSFDEPIEQLETVVFLVKRLADELVAQLAADGRACARIVIMAETEHGERCERAWYRDHGLSATAIVERARWQLDGWAQRPGGLSGGVTLVRLVPEEVRSDDGHQGTLWGGRSQADDDATRAVVRLTGLAGEHAVTVPVWEGGRLPSERYRLVPAASVDLDDPSARLDRGEGPWPGSVPTPSPTVVPPQPVPIELLAGDGRAVAVTGRGEISDAPAELVVGSSRHRIVAWAGPWPLEQRWWTPERSRRLARMQVVTEGGAAHLVGIEQQRWSILATYA